MKWTLSSKDLPPECTIVLGFCKEWIDEDYNPEGIRDCFYNDSYWCSSFWNNEQDGFDTDWNTNPTYWMQRPNPPK